MSNVRIVYTYIRCSRILGGQNTSASLRKILADALQALPRDDRTKQRSGVEVFTVSLRQCSRTADRVPNVTPSIPFSLSRNVQQMEKKWSPVLLSDCHLRKYIGSQILSSHQYTYVDLQYLRFTKKLHFYILLRESCRMRTT